MAGFADAGCLSDPHKARSQTGYVFTVGGTAISWRSQKQTLVATSSNHAEIIALHETSKECVWLRSISKHILSSSGINFNSNSTIMKTMHHVSLKQRKNTSKVIKPNIFHRSSSHIPKNSRRIMKLK